MKPTFEEFRELVKANLAEHLGNIDEKELEAYLEEDESKRIIQERYDHGTERINSGEITPEIFRNGVAAGAASCLSLLY